MEKWVNVKGYEGIYMVSDLGNVKALARTFWSEKRKCFINKKERLMSMCNSSGYKLVQLYKNRIPKNFLVHQLVYYSFYGVKSCQSSPIDHINNDKSDNRIMNLQKLTHRENISKTDKVTSSIYTGVSYRSDIDKWRARITIKGKVHHLGNFETEIEAAEEYERKLDELVKVKGNPWK